MQFPLARPLPIMNDGLFSHSPALAQPSQFLDVFAHAGRHAAPALPSSMVYTCIHFVALYLTRVRPTPSVRTQHVERQVVI